jgi:hypothetical protein
MSRRVLLSALSLVAACSESPVTFSDASRADLPDATSADAACAANQWVCDGTRARRCDGRGGYAETRDCFTAGSVCVPGRGCATCLPDNTQCSAANVPQRCAADGTRWVDQSACDTAGGFRCVRGRCVRPCDNLGASYLGCEYWPSVTANGSLPEEFEFAVAVSNTQAYPITVTVEGGGLAMPLTRTVGANGLETVVLPWVAPLSGGGMRCCAGVFDTQPNCLARSNRVIGGAYHLRSDGPVAVYQFNPLQFRAGSRFSFSNDASLLLPQNALGREYLVMSWPNTGPPFATPADRCVATGLRGGFVAIVNSNAARNRVVVRTTAPVFAPGDPARTVPPGELAFDLNPGEALQLVSHGVDLTRAVDLTGTSIRADLPVAVYSGHECANVPNERLACDHLEEQLFPLETWGRRYAVSPLRYRGSDQPAVVRIMAQRDGATLTFDGVAAPAGCARTLMRGEYCELETASPFQVTGSMPILVAQFMRGLGDDKRCRCGGGVCTDAPECEGDPAMVLEVPVDQYRTDYRFLVPASYANNYLNVVAPMGADLDLDGRPLVGAVTRAVGAGLVMHQLAVPAGVHDLRAADGRARFGIKVYGVAPYTSYAYAAGLDLAPISPP